MNDLNKSQASQTALTISDLTTLIRHYRDEAERARRIAAAAKKDNTIFMSAKGDNLPDAGLEFDRLANKFEDALRKLSIAMLEESGLAVPMAHNATVKDEKVTKSKRINCYRNS